MKRLRLLPLLLVLAFVPPAHASNPYAFGAIVRRFSRALHRSPEHPRLLGTVMFFVRLAARFHGASGLNLAVFDVPRRLPLDAFTARLLAPAWSRMLLSEDRRGGDQSLVYIRPGHKHCRMLIVSQDGGDHQVSLVVLRVGPKVLMREADSAAN